MKILEVTGDALINIARKQQKHLKQKTERQKKMAASMAANGHTNQHSSIHEQQYTNMSEPSQKTNTAQTSTSSSIPVSSSGVNRSDSDVVKLIKQL